MLNGRWCDSSAMTCIQMARVSQQAAGHAAGGRRLTSAELFPDTLGPRAVRPRPKVKRRRAGQGWVPVAGLATLDCKAARRHDGWLCPFWHGLEVGP